MSKIYHKNCRWCGDPFDTDNRNKKLCQKCDDVNLGKKRKKEPYVDKLLEMQREVDEYNRKHGTALSYGQYVLKFGK